MNLKFYSALGCRFRHFAQAALEIATLAVIGNESEGACVAARCFSAEIKASQEIGTRRVDSCPVQCLGQIDQVG